MKRNILKGIVSILLVCTFVLGVASCTVGKAGADNLTKDLIAREMSVKQPDDAFISSSADFAFKLFQSTITASENSLISPLSVMVALAMTANGADTETKAEMEKLLGGTISLEDLNTYLSTYLKNLPTAAGYKFTFANSIWIREDKLVVEKDFLQTNVDYFNAEIFKASFGEQTVKDINRWVDKSTDGMIKEMLDELSKDAVMYLINALVFDAEWEKVYEKKSVNEGKFTAVNGTVRSVDMMGSGEQKYIEMKNAVGFIKDYKDGKYSFVALLPNEGIDINDFASSLTASDFLGAVKGAKDADVYAKLPKFSYDYDKEMSTALKALGMPLAFDDTKADFSKIGSSPEGNLFIGRVLHKTFISVDARGTKAGAATAVEMEATSAPSVPMEVHLDRPFVYAIVDNQTNVPLFIGTVMDIVR